MTATTDRDHATIFARVGVDQIFNIVNYSLLTLFMLLILYPLIYILSASFSDGAAVISGRVVLWPVDFSLEAYKKIFNYQSIWTGYGNTIFYTVVGTVVNVAMTLIAAYPLSRAATSMGAISSSGLFLFTLFFSGGLIPSYLLVKESGNAQHPCRADHSPGIVGVEFDDRHDLFPHRNSG